MRIQPSRGAAVAAAVALLFGGRPAAGQQFQVSFTRGAHAGPITGRLVLVVSKTREPEPRLAISPSGPAAFGVDLDQVAPDQAVVVDDGAVGYPWKLSSLPPGDYFVQAVINVYEKARRSDGHTIWVHLNDGSTEFFTTAAGNLYSEVQAVHVAGGAKLKVALTKVMQAEPGPQDTEWLKHVKIQSKKLTEFWGRPIYIHATVLLPKGYEEHPNVRYPSIYPLGHSVPFSFTTDSTAVRNPGQINPVTGLDTGYDFYKAWSSPGFPRVLAITLEQNTPYFPDSYSVNSANNGPYGDAIVDEVIPYLEEHFRIIRHPYARHLEGASTSGWQTLALQLQHPEAFGGAWVLQPDPIDFRKYQQVDIYKDDNAFTIPAGQFTTTERPFRRTVEGQVVWTARQLSLFEEVLGTRGRSGFQLEAWEAVYGPTDADGYPKPLWNKLTGVIDRDVAHYMRDHGFDLRSFAEKNWATLGPKLVGKLHFFAGDMDDFYLNLAVYQFEDFLKSSSNPHYEAEFTYGRPKKGHSWHAFPWSEMVRRMAAVIREAAPAGEASAWSY
ncbi:MAG: hypothetical protein ABI647_04295 [Gemmatimonadota bacterium]